MLDALLSCAQTHAAYGRALTAPSIKLDASQKLTLDNLHRTYRFPTHYTRYHIS